MTLYSFLMVFGTSRVFEIFVSLVFFYGPEVIK